jgi:vacuolar protein sorting-associated protein 35
MSHTLLLQDMEEEQVMVARMLHQLSCDDLRLQFAILRAARAHLELGGPARMRHTLPALAFCALKALRRLLPQTKEGATPAEDAAAAAAAADAAAAGAGAAAAEEAVSAESALQWLLEVALQLAEVPAPMPALRLLLVCAHVSSEEAGLEMLAYEFFEQVGAGGTASGGG